MKSFSSRHLFFAGLALLLATNVFVLGGIRYNRSGTPDTLITLSERELELPYRLHEDNSGLSLHLNWRTLARQNDSGSYSEWGSPPWFDEEKLKEIGYREEQLRRGQRFENSARRPLPKNAFIVLELDGKTHQEALNQAKQELAKKEGEKKEDEIKWARQRLIDEQLSKSRLFAIDAGLDPVKLRRKYPDPALYLIARGQVKPSSHYNEKSSDSSSGIITDLCVEDIHVPLSHRQALLPFLKDDRLNPPDKKNPRYQVVLAYGKRFEPWIESVKPWSEHLTPPLADH